MKKYMKKCRCYMGCRLKELRQQKLLSQKDICILLGISQAVYNSWETDKREPCLMDAYRLAEILGVSLEYLVAGDY